MSESSTESGNLLTETYRQYIGPGTDNEAIGYWLYVLGAILGVLAIGVYLYSTTLEGADAFTPREIAGVMGGLGLMLLLLGVVVRLPTHPRVTWVGVLGAAISVIGIAWFVVEYPDNWSTPAGNGEVVAVYSLGAALLVLSAIILPAVVRTPETVIEEVETRTAEEPTASKATLEIYRDRAEDHRWRLRHDNGNIIASSGQGYSSKQKAKQGASSVKKNVAGADVVEITRPEDAAQASFEVFEDSAGEWRWRLRHDNGNIIADSGEGYTDRSAVESGIGRVRSYAASADELTLEHGAFDLYEDSAGEWRWRLLASNGRIIADSGEGYASRSNGQRAIETVRNVDEHEFEVFEDDGGRYRWRLVAGNNETIADSGQGYSREQGARDAVERVQRIAPAADTLELEAGAFDLFKDKAEEWRWRLLAPNGEIIADSGEGYSSRAKARQGLTSVRRNAPHAPVDRSKTRLSHTGMEQ